MRLRKMITILLVIALLAGLSLSAFAADVIWKEDPTGYTQASDVVYVTSGGKIANWGVREETATFLTTYALNYYTGDYTYEALSAKQGNANTASTPSSALYKALQSMLKSKQTSTTSYAGTRDLYKYTDCMVGNYNNISSFYSGRKLKGEWDSGSTWNREHTWPNSKISGNGENDIMMLRPTSVQENSDRGNKAYGEASGCYDPNIEATPNGFNVRGDCARIILYVYVRWGETNDVLNNMWGTSGVMESLDILLKWMQEDPVDTWELGRNDAVQSITGVRNVFVDYPEFAWLLFGQSVPAGYPTPSGSALGGEHVHNYQAVVTAPTCTEQGYTTFTCSICGDSYVGNYTDALGHNYVAAVTAPTCTEQGYTTFTCSICSDSYVDNYTDALGHNYVAAVTAPSCTAAGYTTYSCSRCDDYYRDDPVEALGHDFVNGVCTRCGAKDPDYESGEDPQPVSFDDVEADAYYAAPVDWAVGLGVTNGTGNGKFSPDAKCTRGQVVTFLWRAKGCPEPTLTENPFSDVKEKDFFYKAVLWAVENEITTGTGGGKFSPGKGCTRGQVVTFLWRTEGNPAVSDNGTPDPGDNELPIIPIRGGDAVSFSDVKESDYFYNAVLWAVANGITQGTGNGKFSPNNTCTRGQIVTFLFRDLAE